jgi:hypothetical protein
VIAAYDIAEVTVGPISMSPRRFFLTGDHLEQATCRRRQPDDADDPPGESETGSRTAICR